MTINTKQILTMTEANQNFSKAAKVAENNGSAVIFKNNKPKYILIDVAHNSLIDINKDENLEVSSRRVIEKYKDALAEVEIDKDL